jgi:antitoxin MazE
MTHAVLGKWGKSLAVRLPHEIASELGLHEGERVEIETASGQIVIRRAAPHYNLEELFAGKSAQEWWAMYQEWWAMYTEAYEWGPDVGREIVEE